MEIQGLPFENNAQIKNLGEKSTRRISSVNLNKKADSVEISGFSKGKEKVDEVSKIKTEFEPRIELIESISRRLSAGEYVTRDMNMNVAGTIVDADIVNDVIINILENNVRDIKVKDANNNVESDNYSNPNIIREIAKQLINVLGFSSLFGNDSNI